MAAPSAHNLLASAAGRRRVKHARRAVLVQCDKCLCKGTGTTNAFGRVSGVDVPARRVRDCWSHRGCGGVMRAFDIGGVR